jgi:hypothetical protein
VLAFFGALPALEEVVTQSLIVAGATSSISLLPYDVKRDAYYAPFSACKNSPTGAAIREAAGRQTNRFGIGCNMKSHRKNLLDLPIQGAA